MSRRLIWLDDKHSMLYFCQLPREIATETTGFKKESFRKPEGSWAVISWETCSKLLKQQLWQTKDIVRSVGIDAPEWLTCCHLSPPALVSSRMPISSALSLSCGFRSETGRQWCWTLWHGTETAPLGAQLQLKEVMTESVAQPRPHPPPLRSAVGEWGSDYLALGERAAGLRAAADSGIR